MNRYVIILILALIGFPVFSRAQTSAAELNQGIQGMSASEYYRLSQEADLFLSKGSYARAAENYEKLTKAFPFDGLKWRRLGLSLYQLKKYREAVEPFMKAHRLGAYEGSTLSSYYIAANYARAGDAEKALDWVEKAVNEYHYPGKPSLLEDPAFESIKTNPRFLKLFNLPKKEFSRDAGWRADLDYLLAEISRLNPVYGSGKQPLPAEFLRAAQRLKTEIPKLSDAEIYFEMQHLLVLLGHTHNSLHAFLAGDLLNLKQMPLTFYVFPEGLYIVDAEKGYEDLIGARITQFDKTATERAMKAVEYVIPRENEMEILWRAPDFLRIVQLLHALKLTDKPDRVNLTVVDREGKTRTVSPEPIAVKRRPKLTAPRLPGIAAPPLYLSKPDDEYWFEHLPQEKAVYFQFNQVSNKEGGESMNQFALRLRGFLAQNNVENLVVDLRRNNGGQTLHYNEMLRTLLDFDIQHPGRLFVIVGRWTFSATGNFITDLSRLSSAVFVGEPSGAKPLMVGGDEASFVLPYSGARGSLSSSTWALTNPRDTRLWITPNIPVQLTAKDYFANCDAVMETVTNLIGRDKK
jgi:tetratricopeptide (TPR) repeat protein